MNTQLFTKTLAASLFLAISTSAFAQTTAERAAQPLDAAGNPIPTSDPADTPPSDPAGTPPGTTTPPIEEPPLATPAPNQEVQPTYTPSRSAATRQPSIVNRPSRAEAFLDPNSESAMNTEFEPMPGCGRRISIAAMDQIYLVGCGPDPRNDALTFHWREGNWDSAIQSGRSVTAVSEIAEDKDSSKFFSGVIVINQEYKALISGAPANQDASFQDMATGNGWIWAIYAPKANKTGGRITRSKGLPGFGCVPGGNWVGSNGICTDFDWSVPFGTLYAKRITAGLSDGIAWAIDEDGKIYRQFNQGEGWTEQGGCATSIANAGNDNVWVIGCDEPDANGNRKIYHWVNDGWKNSNGYGVEIAVQPNGVPWVITADGGIWRRKSP
jgi:hypothetical protein